MTDALVLAGAIIFLLVEGCAAWRRIDELARDMTAQELER